MRAVFQTHIRAWGIWGAALARRQPLLLATPCFLAGLLAAYRASAGVSAAVLAAGAASVALAAVRRASGGHLALIALMLPLGWGRATWDLGGRRRESAAIERATGRREWEVRVGSEVAMRPLRGQAARYTFLAEQASADGAVGTIRHLPVEVRWYGGRAAAAGSAPQPGETWRLIGRANIRTGRNGLPMLVINSGSDRSARLAPADPRAWSARVAAARRQAERRVILGIETWGAVPALNQAMLLGSRDVMPGALRRAFANSGTIHVFAISGLHIALVAALLTVAIRMAGISSAYWVVPLAPLLVFYTVATGARPSAVRACLMAVIYFAAPLAGRKPNGAAALMGAALLMHAARPWLIFDVGNILSFTVMGGLVVFCRPFCDRAGRFCGADALARHARLHEAAGERRLAKRARAMVCALRFLGETFAVSLAAWLVSVPLTAYYFGRFTPGGLLANMVVVPCSFLVVAAGCLGLAASFISAWVAACFNHAAGAFTLIMIWTAEWVAASSWGSLRVARGSMGLVIAWYAALTALAVWLYARRPSGLEWVEGEE